MAQPMAQNDGEGITAGYDKGFFIQTADGDIQLKINGYLRYHLYLSEANTVANTGQHNTFKASESRIDFHIYLMKDWHIRIRPDFSGKDAYGDNGSLREAYIEYLGMDCLKFRIGTFVVPFSLEYETSPADLMAIAYSPYLGPVPLRDMGAMIFGNGIPCVDSEYLATHFMYSVGLFNGQGLNVGDSDDDKMFAAQAKFFPLGNKDQQVFAQASVFLNNGDMRNNAGTISLGALQGHNVFDGSSSDTLDNTNGRSVGVAAGFRYWKGNWRIEGEYVWMRANRDDDAPIGESATPLEVWGASLGASYLFSIGEAKKNMGLEPLVKVSYTDIDDKGGDGTSSNSSDPVGTTTDVRGQQIWEIALGAKFHFNKNVRFDFNWVMYDLKETRESLTNNERGEGGGLLHAFVFQFMTKW